MSDLRAAVRAATARLADAGVPSPQADAIALAAHALGCTPSDVHTAMVLGRSVPHGYDELIEARAARVPLQHLTGRAAFRHLELEVGPGVFVPRPETEVLVDLALAELEALTDLRSGAGERGTGRAPLVVDLCTGSGAIAPAVKDEYPAAVVHAVELSDLAHAWAARNVESTGRDVELHLGDATTALPKLEGTVDVVTCNPPYVPVGQVPNDPEVRDHDPELALYGGSDDGPATPLRLAARAAELLRPGGVLLMEHADSQGESLPGALRASGQWSEVSDHRDLTGRARVAPARRGNT